MGVVAEGDGEVECGRHVLQASGRGGRKVKGGFD